jgi:hypothetical protein
MLRPCNAVRFELPRDAGPASPTSLPTCRIMLLSVKHNTAAAISQHDEHEHEQPLNTLGAAGHDETFG